MDYYYFLFSQLDISVGLFKPEIFVHNIYSAFFLQFVVLAEG